MINATTIKEAIFLIRYGVILYSERKIGLEFHSSCIAKNCKAKVLMPENRENDVKRLCTIDFISKLPQSILHHILAFLPDKDAARTAILSTTWRPAWYSLPIVVFDEKLFGINRDTYDAEKERKFFDFANMRISHYPQNLQLHKFKLCVSLDNAESVSQVKRWIGFALNAKVKELDLDIVLMYKNSGYFKLPLKVLLAKSIRFLNLQNCKLQNYRILRPPLSLEKVHLAFVELDTKVIENLLSNSLLEELEMHDCRGLEFLQIYSCSLLKLKLSQNMSLISIKIRATNLCSLILDNGKSPQCIVKVLDCCLLRRLTLRRVNIKSDGWSKNGFSKYPLLENLVLENCKMLETIEITNERLKTIQLLDCESLVELMIGTQIQTFIYRGKLVLLPPIITSGSLNEVTLALCCNVEPEEWFAKLRQFLVPFSYSKTLNIICKTDKDIIIPQEKRDGLLPSLCDVKHLNVQVNGHSLNSITDLVDSLLWLSPHLETLVIDSFSGTISFKLEHREEDEVMIKEAEVCCGHLPLFCWRHRLKKVTVAARARQLQGLINKQKVTEFIKDNTVSLEQIPWQTAK
ncbi:F-box domain [Dillenia turbinata]|uniref:F-box domain n=1 Tax=Dillenia turbinata TaxID=194707 RepID=A0AAN8UM94_9MAGN